MLPTLLTIDTEYSSGLYQSGVASSCDENFDRCIRCNTTTGEAGIFYQMDVLEQHGLTATFFVDPMPALVWGNDAIKRIVAPILERGHEVQLHLHTEWLELAENNGLTSSTGQNIADFSQDEQIILLEYAMGQLTEAGAPRPVAFRAGNYGANDNTLRALAKLGLQIETSHPPGLAVSDCEISLGVEDFLPMKHQGMVELPIGLIGAAKGGVRHAQITALSKAELKAGVDHARQERWPAFVIVSHSFELANRKRQIANRVVKNRFEQFCSWLGRQEDCVTMHFSDLDTDQMLQASERLQSKVTPLPYKFTRTAWRVGEQAVANLVYG